MDQIREAHAKFKIMVDKYYGPDFCDFWIYKVLYLYTIKKPLLIPIYRYTTNFIAILTRYENTEKPIFRVFFSNTVGEFVSIPIPGDLNVSDYFTKDLSVARHDQLIDRIIYVPRS